MSKHDHKGNGHGHVTETPDVSHIKNVDVVHETSDVNVPALLKFVLALTVMTVAVYFLMLFLFNFLSKQETRNEPAARTRTAANSWRSWAPTVSASRRTSALSMLRGRPSLTWPPASTARPT